MRTEIIEELEETEVWVEHLSFAFINSGNINTESHRAGVYIYAAVKIESLCCKMAPGIPHLPTITRHSTAYVPVSSYLTTSRQPQASFYFIYQNQRVQLQKIVTARVIHLQLQESSINPEKTFRSSKEIKWSSK